MSVLHQTIGTRLLWIFGLAIFLSLAVYPLANARAMHGQNGTAASKSASYATAQSVLMPSDGHQEEGADNHHGADKKIAKQDCCQDFCFSMALPLSHDALSHPRIVSIRTFCDEREATGQVSLLYRPPSN